MLFLPVQVLRTCPLPIVEWELEQNDRFMKLVIKIHTSLNVKAFCSERTVCTKTTRRPPDHRKETPTAVVWSCLPFIRSGQNHRARHSEWGKKTRQTEEEVGRRHQEMDRPGVRQVPDGNGEQGKMEKTGCGIICGAPTTLAAMGLMMMMMMMMKNKKNTRVSVPNGPASP